LSGDRDGVSGHVAERRGHLSLRGLRKEYASGLAVRELSLDIRPGEFFTLLGPSGSGKTTTLMMVAGFETPTSGAVLIDGRDVARVPPDLRNVGVVFHNYALFPHMTVHGNLAFPLEVRGQSPAEIERRITEVLELVRLGEHRWKFPAQLSGGQQQRVAIARAVVYGPPILLMDEPLGALDKKLRGHLQLELRSLASSASLSCM
jgi:putative spermidine/putrescine transport system ATP-binding protein